MFFHDVLGATADALEKPDLTSRTLGDECVEHAHDGGHADATADEDNAAAARGIKEELPGGRFDVEDVALVHFVMKKGGDEAGLRALVARWDSLDRDSVGVCPGAIGKTVAADDQLLWPGTSVER